ncbi:hypothetical protein V8F20_000605 [Naviculisporaceae sp. PSN 640]
MRWQSCLVGPHNREFLVRGLDVMGDGRPMRIPGLDLLCIVIGEEDNSSVLYMLKVRDMLLVLNLAEVVDLQWPKSLPLSQSCICQEKEKSSDDNGGQVKLRAKREGGGNNSHARKISMRGPTSVMGVETCWFWGCTEEQKADCTQKPVFAFKFGCVLTLAEAPDIQSRPGLNLKASGPGVAGFSAKRSLNVMGLDSGYRSPTWKQNLVPHLLEPIPGPSPHPGHSRFRHSSNPVDCDFPSLYGYQARTATTHMLLACFWQALGAEATLCNKYGIRRDEITTETFIGQPLRFGSAVLGP